MTDNLKTLLHKAALAQGLDVHWRDDIQEWMEDTGKLFSVFNPTHSKAQLVDLEDRLRISVIYSRAGYVDALIQGGQTAQAMEVFSAHQSTYYARVMAVLRCAAAYYDAMQ